MLTPRQLLLVTTLLAAGPALSAQDLVVSSTTPVAEPTTSTSDSNSGGAQAPSGRPDVYSLHVTSRITHRYARTLVSSRLANRASQAQEAQFSLVLPETAFISAFLIETEGKVYEAYVKEKEEAKKEYDAALAGGQTAAHVAVSARDANTFNVAVNVAPGQKVTFNLTYEELLARRLGAYTHAVHVAPGQLVRDLRVEVAVEESRNLTLLRAPVFRAADADADADADTDASAAAAAALAPALTTERVGGAGARVVFAPSPEQQRALAAALANENEARDRLADADAAAEGLVGQLVVQYDVERDPQGGEVLLDQGYFVHFFAPDDLPPLPKHVIFVLDVSGSMEGRKIEQLKKAMATILGDLKPGDYFNLLEFSYSVTVWNLDSASNNVVYSPYSQPGEEKAEPPAPAAYPASAEYVQKAKEIVQRMTAGGGTNIHDALRTALAVARGALRNATQPEQAEQAEKRPEPIIVFLTDGEPTVGESRPHKIFQMVSERNERPAAALFSLAFGDDADLPFLKKLSLRNNGFARKIYEAADAALQLRNFYRGVASPLLSNVSFEYTAEDVKATAVTKKRFPAFFAGSELVVAGQLVGAGAGVSGAVKARGDAGERSFAVPRPPPSQPAPGKSAPSLERLWAYLSIRQLLDEREANSGFEDAYDDALPDANLTDAQQTARAAAAAAKKRALQLALQYSFVTPLTSLVVVKPNGSSAADLEGARRPPVPFQSIGGQHFSVDRISGPALALEAYDDPSLLADAVDESARTTEAAEATEVTTLPQDAPRDTTSPPSSRPGVTLGSLSDLQWLTNALNGTTGSLLVPLANGTRLLRIGVNEENKPFEDCPLPEDAGALTGTAHCRHLPHCVLPAISKDIQNYVRYFCSIGDFAGVCCPDAAFASASLA